MNSPLNLVNILVYKYGNTQPQILQAFANLCTKGKQDKKTEITVFKLIISVPNFYFVVAIQ